MSKRIGMIGHFGANEILTDGQTVKTREVNNQVEKKYNIKTAKIDTYLKKYRNPFILVFAINKMLRENDYILLTVSQRGYKVINIIMYFLNRFYKRTLFDLVIGGNRYKIYDKGKLQKKAAQKYKMIYVETNFMKEEYAKRGLTNVTVFPNFKNIKKQEFIDPKNDKLKLCVFSRISKYKGIDAAIEAVIKANKIIGKNLVELDLYGKPDEDYKTRLEQITSEMPEFIKYKGFIDPNKSTDVLKDYDIMLFLTFWQGEGFPGTLIDAFFSGLPVIASDWNYNFIILKENYTGFKVGVNDVDAVAKLLVYYSDKNNRSELIKMRKNCLEEANNYVPEQVMEKLYKYIDD